jgi:hypothetical protein
MNECKLHQFYKNPDINIKTITRAFHSYKKFLFSVSVTCTLCYSEILKLHSL